MVSKGGKFHPDKIFLSLNLHTFTLFKKFYSKPFSQLDSIATEDYKIIWKNNRIAWLFFSLFLFLFLKRSAARSSNSPHTNRFYTLLTITEKYVNLCFGLKIFKVKHIFRSTVFIYAWVNTFYQYIYISLL